MPTCFWILVVSSPTCLWWKRGPVAIFLGKSHKEVGNSKGSQIHCAKKFSGAAKIARFNLYCATKLLGTAKVARFTVPKIFLGAAKIARFSLYCETKLLGTAKVARFTVPKIFLQDSVFTVRQSFWEQQR